MNRWVYMASLGLPIWLTALPSSPKVVEGKAAFGVSNADNLTIEVDDHSIIEYDSFHIAEKESVLFVQPSKEACVLNRVVGLEPSTIAGKIQANGRVFFVNPHGVYFGAEAEVNVGSLIVSTYEIADHDFLENRFMFSQNDFKEGIVNEGSLQAKEGVVLLSKNISQKGTIIAKVGSVILASGEKVVLDFTGDGLINFLVEKSDPVLEGNLFISSDSKEQILESLVNVEGVVFGDSFVEEGSCIYLAAASEIQGKEIVVSAETVTFTKTLIEALGDEKGGQIRVYADRFLHLDAETRLYAESKIKGEGGLITLCSDGELAFEGAIFAKGGHVEMAAEKLGTITGLVDVGVEKGEWLLSLQDVTVSEEFLHPDVLNKSPSSMRIKTQEGSIRIESPLIFRHKKVGLSLEGKNIHLDREIVTRGGPISLQGSFFLTTDSKIDTTAGGRVPEGADIVLSGGMDGQYKLLVDAGSSGRLQVGSQEQKGLVTLSSLLLKGKAINLYANMAATGGTIIFEGPVNLMGDLTIEDVGPTGIIFLDTLDSFGVERSLVLTAPRAKVAFLGPVGSTLALENLTIEAQRIQLQADLTVSDTLLMQGALRLSQDVQISALTLQMLGTIDGSYDLTLDATSAGTITFSQVVGEQARLKNFTIKKADFIDVKGIYAETILQEEGGEAFYGSFLDTIGAGGISLTGDSFTFLGSIQATNKGGFVLNNAADAILGPDLEISLSGSFSQIGAGSTTLSGILTTRGKSIAFAGPLTLNGALSISTGNGAGYVLFGSSVNGDFSLDLTMGIGDLTFSEAVGGFMPLGDIVIHSVRNVTAGDISAKSLTQQQGFGLASYQGNIETSGILGIDLTSTYLTFAGRRLGKILHTIGGDIIVNAVYGGINNHDNPVEVNVDGGLGNLFVGGAYPGYFSSAEDAVKELGSVRSNVPCFVEYNDVVYKPRTTPIPL